MPDDQVLVDITETTCDGCGRRTLSYIYIFRTGPNSFSYHLSSERRAALSDGTIKISGHFYRREQMPKCPACIGSIPAGWPDRKDFDHRKIAFGVERGEPTRAGQRNNQGRDHKSPAISAASIQKAKGLLDEL